MRRYLIAAAAAGGLLLLGGAPAYADVNPAPNGGPLGGILDPAGGISLDNPLGDAPLIGVKPGTNTPSLPTLPGTAEQPAAQPAEAGLPAARTGLGGAKTGQAPAADVVGESPIGSVGAGNFSVANVPVGGLLSGGGLSNLGLMPDGSPAAAAASTAPGTNAKATEAGLLGSGVPLLGGLGGLLPEPARTLPADVPDTAGMPAGGTVVDDQDTPAEEPSDKPTGQVADAPDPSGPGDDDKRLHEEPIDGEAGGTGRAFSDGRPVGSQDPDFD